MAKLPFVVQPRRKPILESIGNDDIGVIEIERRGYLTVGEKATIQSSMSDNTAMAELYALGAVISSELDMDVKEVLQDLFNNAHDKYAKWDKQIKILFTELTNYQSILRLTQATVLIQSRCSSKWSVQDTMDMHPDLLEAVGTLYEEEEAQSLEAFENKEKEKVADTNEEVKE